MKRLCAVLFLLAASTAQAGQLVRVPGTPPGADVYIDMDTNDIYPSGGGLPINPNTGEAILPGRGHALQPQPVQPDPAPQPARPARAVPVMLNCEQLADRIDYLHGTLQYLGEHDPDFPAVRRNWRAQKADYARRCQ